ncbi:MAG TPA: flagellar motor switch protein FliM [Ramlibacter sp.]|nr:flagellar motor switch protein FliM [Ramlibacter sp.]
MAYTAVLSQEEIDNLLKEVDDGSSGALGTAATAAADGVTPYDPAAPSKIVRGRMRTLDLINERFARNLREGLLTFVRRSPDITSVTLEAQTYGDFLKHLPVPANINMLRMDPLRGTGLFVFDPNLVFLVVDNLFGSDGRFHMRIEGREFTRTEMRIIRRLLDITLTCYADAWKLVKPLQFQYLRSETGGKLANIVADNEVVLTTTLNIEIGPKGGFLHVCLPYSMLEPVRDQLYDPVQKDENEGDERWERQMAREIRAADVELAADFVTLESTVGGLLQLHAGQILPFEPPRTVTAAVDGTPVLQCGYGRSQTGRYALRVEQVLDHALEEKCHD